MDNGKRSEVAAGGLTVAVVGCGYWGANYVRILDSLTPVTTVVACDPRPDVLNSMRDRFPRVQAASSIDDLLARFDVDAAVIATPATTHYEVAGRLIAAGCHLLVEKPITTRSADAMSLVEIAKQRGIVLAVGHTFLHHPAVKRIDAFMTEGALGTPYYLYARRTNLGPIRNDVNAIWDLAPHDISIFNHLLRSEPRWVSAVGHRVLRRDREDVGFISLGYPDNVLAHIHVSWADPNKVRELVVVGQDRRILFDDMAATERVRIYEKGVSPAPQGETFAEELMIRDGDIISPRIEPSEPLKNQCLDFLDCVTSGREPVSDGTFGSMIVRTMEAIDRSIRLEGVPIDVLTGRAHQPLMQETVIDIREEALIGGQAAGR